MLAQKDILSGSLLFKGLPDTQLKKIMAIATEKEYAKNHPIFSEGAECTGFFVVAQGTVKIFKLSSEGKEQILHIFGPGEPFGEVPVFTGRNIFPANAETIRKSRLLFFPRNDFVELVTGDPSLALNMLAVLSMRLRQFTIQVENLSLKEVPGRIAAYLLYLSKEQFNESSVTLTISKGQLASLLGTIPETLSRILSKMSEQKLIEVKGKNIGITDREGLEELAECGKLQP